MPYSKLLNRAMNIISWNADSLQHSFNIPHFIGDQTLYKMRAWELSQGYEAVVHSEAISSLSCFLFLFLLLLFLCLWLFVFCCCCCFLKTWNSIREPEDTKTHHIYFKAWISWHEYHHLAALSSSWINQIN